MGHNKPGGGILIIPVYYKGIPVYYVISYQNNVSQRGSNCSNFSTIRCCSSMGGTGTTKFKTIFLSIPGIMLFAFAFNFQIKLEKHIFI